MLKVKIHSEFVIAQKKSSPEFLQGYQLIVVKLVKMHFLICCLKRLALFKPV